MKKVSRLRRLALAVLAALWLPPVAWAGDAAPVAGKKRSDAERRAVEVDRIEVTARGTAADWPSALATDTLDYEDAIAAPADLQDWLARSPGVAATGQNGLFETFSIRGSGGNAILTLVGGMPITAQRRAGVPLSFVEPLLLGDVTVTRGPAVTHYGPGALGGAVSIEPRWFDRSMLAAGYGSGGDENLLAAATGSDSFSLAAARHRAGATEAPDGTPLNTGYQRESATLQYRTSFGDFDLDALLLPSRSTEIGKSNSRYPARVTTYPIDRHHVGRVRLQHAGGVELSLHAHGQRLDTYNQRPGSPDTFASIRGTDLGTTLQRRFAAGPVDYDIGVEYLGRRGVEGFDASGSLANRSYSLRDASETNLSLFALADWRASNALELEFGLRGSRNEQRQQGAAADDSDAAFTLGAAWQPGPSGRWTANLSSGYRFATLEERYFTGVTAQGEIVGNPALRSEHSLGIDVGHAWNRGNWSGALHLWRMEVDDLIQLTGLGGDLDGYTNVGEATSHGAEAMLDVRLGDAWSLRGTAAHTRGRNELSDEPLYGIGPPDLALEARYRRDRHALGVRYAHREPMRRPGFEEVRRGDVDAVDAELAVRLRSGLELELFVRNALDRRYFATADVLSALAPERSVGIQLVWRAD